MLKKIISLILVVAITASISITGTMAYLQSEDSDVNVMTLGNVKIEQHEYERAVDADGNFVTYTETERDGEPTGYKLAEFTQAKPLMPATGTVTGWDETKVYFAQLPDESTMGLMEVLDGINNVQDKFVFVENTGKSDAYVRTLIAFEAGSITTEEEFDELVMTCNHSFWDVESVGFIEIDGNNYLVYEYNYTGAEGANGKHPDGIVHPGEYTYCNLSQVYLKSKATNEDVDNLDGNNNGTYDILVLSQAVQAAGFDNAVTALDTAFGKSSENAAEWFGGTYIPDYSIPEAKVIDGVVTLEDGEKAVISGTQVPFTVKGNGTLYLRNLTVEAAEGDAIKVDGTEAKLIVEGDVTVTSETGSAITGTALNISGTTGATLTAIAGDAKGAFGIGGMNTATIEIKDLTIKEVVGGFDGEIGTDTKYYKDAPEGGSAIGSGLNGATITLNNVHIEKAIGGSKAAGIGARYHVGVNVNIKDSTIDYVEGGASAAGIGGSRVSGDLTESGTSITINNSTINAKGGVYGAGIGSGYDTHCQAGQPICTINITGNSVITAQGGQYAAGIGTGYHNAGLAGTIDETVTVNATSGEKFYKDAYTQAQDVGFGVVDPAREAKDNTSSINYKGTVISITK